MCARTACCSRIMANLRIVPLFVVVGLRSPQSRLKPPPSTDFFNHLLYCYKCILTPWESTKLRNHPHDCSPPLSVNRIRRIADWREYRHLCHACTQTPSRLICHSCTRVSRAASVRGSCGMLGSRCGSVRSRRASVRGSPLAIGTDTAQPRPRCCPCTHRPVCREGPG